tara:strand:- start:935 stop:1378 length:444 start_codon:yes stop_codon:yes gene_type:complete
MTDMKLGGDSVLKALTAILRHSGLRMTTQRRLIASIIDQSESHPDAEEIHLLAQRKDPNISLSTVYRTLAVLREWGLVRGHRFTEEHSHFEAGTGSIHHHLICTKCGLVEEFENGLESDSVRRISRKTKFRILSQKIELTGLCESCK